MTEEIKNPMKKSRRWKYIIPICLFFVFTFVFYGSLSLYLPNSEKLWFPLSSVWRIVVLASLISLAVLRKISSHGWLPVCGETADASAS